MRRYRSRIERHMEALEADMRANMCSQADFEEWRTHPVTLALFDALEFETTEHMLSLADSHQSSEDLYGMQNYVRGCSRMADIVFSFVPPGAEIQEDGDEA